MVRVIRVATSYTCVYVLCVYIRYNVRVGIYHTCYTYSAYIYVDLTWGQCGNNCLSTICCGSSVCPKLQVYIIPLSSDICNSCHIMTHRIFFVYFRLFRLFLGVFFAVLSWDSGLNSSFLPQDYHMWGCYISRYDSHNQHNQKLGSTIQGRREIH